MLKNILALAFIMANRFFGLFIILPVLSLYANNLKYANTFLLGLLLGIYALAQIIFQLPFGKLSDKIGRKKTITLALLLFILGSLICAKSENIYFMLLGRILQGSAAIGSVVLALLSDFIEEDKRSKAMAIVGIMIGLSFTFAMIISPLMARKYGLSSLFYLSAFLSFLSIIMLFTLVDKEKIILYPKEKASYKEILLNKDLALMNFTNFMQKMLLSSAFLIFPLLLSQKFGFARENLWKIYSLSALFGFISMLFAGFLSDVKGKSKEILLSGILLFILAYLLFWQAETLNFFIFGIIIFFIAFNIHEPIMQALASKFVLPSQKGQGLGIFTSFGYFGSFFGGAFAGFIMKNYDSKILFFLYLPACLLWFFLLKKLTNPKLFKILYLEDEKFQLEEINKIPEVLACYKSQDYLVLKFNLSKISEEELLKKIQGEEK